MIKLHYEKVSEENPLLVPSEILKEADRRLRKEIVSGACPYPLWEALDWDSPEELSAYCRKNEARIRKRMIKYHEPL